MNAQPRMRYKELLLKKGSAVRCWLVQERTSQQVLALLKIVFFAYCLLFPFGKAFQVGGGVLGLVLLIAYYAGGYAQSNLAYLPFKWVLGLFVLYPFIMTVFSQWPGHSFGYTRHILYESLPLLFVGLECIRSKKDMRIMGLFLLGCVFLQGLDGIWQFSTGFDLVNGTPVTYDGRLTGSMGTYRVGNYLAIVMLPALLAFWALPKGLPDKLRGALLALAMMPPLFLLVMSQTRSGMLGLAAGLYCYAAVTLRLSIKMLAAPVVLGAVLVIFGPERVSLSRFMQDGRWELWDAALQIFREYPWFGAGASTFRPAFKELGIEFVINDSGIPHPHGIFMQFLSDGGITGFVLLAGVLVGIGFLWCGIQVFKGIRRNSGANDVEHWRMTGLLWAGFVAYLGTGLFGHNFYRTWWLALGLMMLGCTLGAVVSQLRGRDE
ncbi:O-antigen ligase family protein [Oleidesulfovibrio sp.]|uniref:O-antigen ligase family protein n=1 Tax=Oleidesulfovibrio sp. TaxID=2909707 RepID=UPI003A8440B2